MTDLGEKRAFGGPPAAEDPRTGLTAMELSERLGLSISLLSSVRRGRVPTANPCPPMSPAVSGPAANGKEPVPKDLALPAGLRPGDRHGAVAFGERRAGARLIAEEIDDQYHFDPRWFDHQLAKRDRRSRHSSRPSRSRSFGDGANGGCGSRPGAISKHRKSPSH